MAKYQLLRSNLKSAWKSTIEKYYNSQLINSESALQVYFCMELMKQFEVKNVRRRIFIEPPIQAQCGSARYPDVLICNKKEIICIIELKYTPRGRPSIKKDFKTLELGLNETLSIKNERYSGPQKNTLKNYTVAADAVLCWAGIYTGECIELNSIASEKNFNNRFFEMHGLTNKKDPPKIWFNGQNGRGKCPTAR
jgi:hypothetical protein